jgi:hypothetical protein
MTATRPAPTLRPALSWDDDPVALWATARALYFARDFPKYASPEWMALRPDDPTRLASALEAAECWRKYGDEEALLAWFKSLATNRESLARRRTLAQLDALARPKPAHHLQATPGWPPIRVPGPRGSYLYPPQEGRCAA